MNGCEILNPLLLFENITVLPGSQNAHSENHVLPEADFRCFVIKTTFSTRKAWSWKFKTDKYWAIYNVKFL